MGPIELLYVVVVGSAIWVFVDAPQRGLSWTWGLGVLALWVVAFPWYLVERGKAKHFVAPAGEWLPDPVNPRLERRSVAGKWTSEVRSPHQLPAVPDGWYSEANQPELERWYENGEWTGATRPKS